MDLCLRYVLDFFGTCLPGLGVGLGGGFDVKRWAWMWMNGWGWEVMAIRAGEGLGLR